jgi:geranylgeranyl pyrophosphate synthase
MPEATRLGILRTVIEEMARLHAGQAMDIAWHRGLRLPDADQYLQMCALKTGTMARMAVRIAAEVAGVASAGDALGRYAESLGVAFQIQDDILNVTPSALSEGKGFGDDIHEGKITLLVIHALERSVAPTRDRLIEILRSHTSDPSRLREAADILATSGALDFGRRTASRLVREAWTEAQAVLPDNAATRKLREFGEYLTTRNV